MIILTIFQTVVRLGTKENTSLFPTKTLSLACIFVSGTNSNFRRHSLKQCLLFRTRQLCFWYCSQADCSTHNAYVEFSERDRVLELTRKLEEAKWLHRLYISSFRILDLFIYARKIEKRLKCLVLSITFVFFFAY